MRKYEHDTSYYGGDILRAIRRVIPQNADLDRGGIYIWVINTKKFTEPLILFLNLNENDNRGSLEIHKSGYFMSQYKYDGILSLNDDCTDCIFNANNANDIVAYLEHYIYGYGNGWK